MKIKFDFIDNDIFIERDTIASVEVENKKYFYRMVKNLYDSINGEYSEEIHFYEDEKEITKPNIALVNDYFNLDLTSKKYIVELYKNIIDLADDNINQDIMNSYKKLSITLNKLIKNVNLPLIIEQDYNLEAILKFMKVSIQKKEVLLETLLLLIDIEHELRLNRIIIFINLKQYLSKEELAELYKYSIYNNIKILLIDNLSYGVCQKNEKKLIIDDNLEEFVL